jgi:glycosyltransferase involved in cell wall biosynthesis
MTADRLRILLWHVHGSWTTAFLQGRHEYVLPVVEGRGPDGLGRARTWNWPHSAIERRPEQLREERFDVVILQRPHELELTHQWTGRRPGVDVPAIYLEHNAPEPHPALSRHPQADNLTIALVHVTHFNQLFWDSGRAPSTVIEHGVLDGGERYTGELPHAAVVINEAARRGRMVGADLLPGFAAVSPIDLFGMGDTALGPGIRLLGDIPQDRMHAELGRRRLYLHTTRWTSLGLALLEAMVLGMPVVAVASTEIGEAVPREAGVVSTDLAVLHDAVRTYTADPEAARLAGKAARHHALARFGIDRFLGDWDRLLAQVMR